MPALATSTSTGPHRSSMAANAASTSSALRTSQRTARKRSGSAPSGGPGGVGRAVGRGDLVAVGQEPVDTGRADAAGPAGDEDDRHQRASGTRSQTSGWPSWTRSPSAASQPMTCPAKGVRTSETPTRPTRSPTSTADGWLGVAVGAGQEARAGRLQRGLGAEDAARRAHHHPLGHVEVLALVQRRLGPPGAGRADLVHQRVEVLGLGDGQRLDLGQAALRQSAEDAARAQLDQRGEARGRRRSRASGASAPGCRAGRRAGRATRPGRRGRARRRWRRRGPRA